MQVFKAFFKIIIRNKAQLLIYIGVFLGVTILVTGANGSSTAGFAETKCRIAYFNEDAGSPISDGLEEYLKDKASFVSIEDSETALQDALFFRHVDYILRVPAGYADRLAAGENPQLTKTTIPESTSGIYVDMLINKYLNTVELYLKNTPALTREEIAAQVLKDLDVNTPVETIGTAVPLTNVDSCAYFFNYFAYAIFAVLILGVSMVMLIFNGSDLKRRNLCSPVHIHSINSQLIMGNLSFAVVAWALMISVGFILYDGYMFTANALLHLLNSFVFTLAALSISFLIANLVKSKGTVSAAANVVALGSSFLSGVFVPQFLLGESVLTIASFTPTYWYVKSNNMIAELANYQLETLLPILTNILIMLGFAVAFLAVTLVVQKQRRQSA